MKRHYLKTDFNVISVTVIALEVLAFIIFILGISLIAFNMFLFPPFFTSFGAIIMSLGATMIAFTLLATAELLQLLMRIEVNTRKK